MTVEEEIERMITVSEIINLIDVSEMDLTDQLTMIQAYIEFANKLEPLAKKYGKSVEHVMELKEKRTKQNIAEFGDILNKLTGKAE